MIDIFPIRRPTPSNIGVKLTLSLPLTKPK